MQCGSLRPTESPTMAPTSSTPSVSPTISPTYTGYTYPPTSAPTECHEQGDLECGQTVTGDVNDGCGNNVVGNSNPDHTYVINVTYTGVREFCSTDVIKLFRGDRTVSLNATYEVSSTTTEGVDGCTSPLVSYKFRVEPGLHVVAVIGCKYFVADWIIALLLCFIESVYLRLPLLI